MFANIVDVGTLHASMENKIQHDINSVMEINFSKWK